MQNNTPFTNEELLFAEALVKITAIERCLIKAGVLTEEQILEEVKSISDQIIKLIKNNKKEN